MNQTTPSPYAKALAKLNQAGMTKKKKRLVRDYKFTLTPSAYTAFRQAAERYDMPVSVYLELLSMQSLLMERLHREDRLT